MPLSASRVLLHPPKRWVLRFDGSSGYVEVDPDPYLWLQNFTLEALIYPYKTGNAYADFEHVICLANWYYLVWDHTSLGMNLTIRRTDGTFVNLRWPSGETFPPNRWYHFIGTYDHSELRLYVNSSYISQPETSDIGTSTLYDLWIGGDGINPQFTGFIAYARIYNRALSASEIQHNYLNPMSPVTDGLVLWLKMEEGSGTTVKDYSGYGNDGTMYGGVEWIEITKESSRILTPTRTLTPVR